MSLTHNGRIVATGGGQFNEKGRALNEGRALRETESACSGAALRYRNLRCVVLGVTSFLWIDDFRRALGEQFRLALLAIDRPGVEDGCHQADNNRATDGRPEPFHRKSLDQIRGEFQQ